MPEGTAEPCLKVSSGRSVENLDQMLTMRALSSESAAVQHGALPVVNAACLLAVTVAVQHGALLAVTVATRQGVP